MLNAAVHGGATLCTLSMSLTDEGLLTVALVDNGCGLPEMGSTPGFGSAVNDSWCRVLGGSWELEMLPGRGTLLSARIPLAGSSGSGLGRGEMSLL